MGAWGHKTFEDDSAFDWYDEFCHGNQSIEILEAALDFVIASKEYIDHDDGMAAFVASEIIAAAKGKVGEKFPDDEYHSFEDGAVPEIKYFRIKKGITDNLIEKAIAAIEKVRDNEQSELRELWAESENYEVWKAEIENLIERVK